MFNLMNREVERQEIIDGPGASIKILEKSYALMEEVNRYYGGSYVICSFLKKEYSSGRITGGKPTRILDLGSGSCDLPAAVIKWGKKNGREIEYTCLETQQAAIDRARKAGRLGLQIRILKEDLFAYQLSEKYDYVTASMVMHHFDYPKILEICQKYLDCVTGALVINDLIRNPLFYLLTSMRTAFINPGVRHDALLSIKKGFARRELERLAADLPEFSVETVTKPLFRIRTVIRAKGD